METTVLVNEAFGGDERALFALLERLNAQLLRIARGRLSARQCNMLEDVDLLHDAAAKLHRMFVIEQNPALKRPRDRSEFLGYISRVMHHHLEDLSRRGSRGVELDEKHMGAAAAPRDTFLFVRQALDRLRAEFPRQAEVFELRTLMGMTIAETRELLGITTYDVRAHHDFASSWLKDELERGGVSSA